MAILHSFAVTGPEMNITRQPVELGDSNRARLPAAADLGQL